MDSYDNEWVLDDDLFIREDETKCGENTSQTLYTTASETAQSER